MASSATRSKTRATCSDRQSPAGTGGLGQRLADPGLDSGPVHALPDPVEVLGGQLVTPAAGVRVVLDQEERRLGPVLLGQVAAQDLGGVSDTPRTLRARGGTHE